MIVKNCEPNKNNRNKYIGIGLAYLFGFLSMGGALNIAGLGCYIILMVVIYDYIERREEIKLHIGILGTWLVGALANVLAPGTFARSSLTNSNGISISKSIINTIYDVDYRLKWFATNTNFAIVLLVVVATTLYFSQEHKNSRGYKIVSILALFAPYVVAFPLALGYGRPVVPNRCEFVIDISIVIATVNFCYMFSVEIANEIDKRYQKVLPKIVLIFSFICVINNSFALVDVKTLQIAEELRTNIYQDHYEEYRAFLERMYSFESGTDIVLTNEEIPCEIDNLYNFYLTDSVEDWVNLDIAHFFGVNNIRIEQ